MVGNKGEHIDETWTDMDSGAQVRPTVVLAMVPLEPQAEVEFSDSPGLQSLVDGVRPLKECPPEIWGNHSSGDKSTRSDSPGVASQRVGSWDGESPRTGSAGGESARMDFSGNVSSTEQVENSEVQPPGSPPQMNSKQNSGAATLRDPSQDRESPQCLTSEEEQQVDGASIQGMAHQPRTSQQLGSPGSRRVSFIQDQGSLLPHVVELGLPESVIAKPIAFSRYRFTAADLANAMGSAAIHTILRENSTKLRQPSGIEIAPESLLVEFVNPTQRQTLEASRALEKGQTSGEATSRDLSPGTKSVGALAPEKHQADGVILGSRQELGSLLPHKSAAPGVQMIQAQGSSIARGTELAGLENVRIDASLFRCYRFTASDVARAMGSAEIQSIIRGTPVALLRPSLGVEIPSRSWLMDAMIIQHQMAGPVQVWVMEAPPDKNGNPDPELDEALAYLNPAEAPAFVVDMLRARGYPAPGDPGWEKWFAEYQASRRIQPPPQPENLNLNRLQLNPSAQGLIEDLLKSLSSNQSEQQVLPNTSSQKDSLFSLLFDLLDADLEQWDAEKENKTEQDTKIPSPPPPPEDEILPLHKFYEAKMMNWLRFLVALRKRPTWWNEPEHGQGLMRIMQELQKDALETFSGFHTAVVARQPNLALAQQVELDSEREIEGFHYRQVTVGPDGEFDLSTIRQWLKRLDDIRFEPPQFPDTESHDRFVDVIRTFYDVLIHTLDRIYGVGVKDVIVEELDRLRKPAPEEQGDRNDTDLDTDQRRSPSPETRRRKRADSTEKSSDPDRSKKAAHDRDRGNENLPPPPPPAMPEAERLMSAILLQWMRSLYVMRAKAPRLIPDDPENPFQTGIFPSTLRHFYILLQGSGELVFQTGTLDQPGPEYEAARRGYSNTIVQASQELVEKQMTEDLDDLFDADLSSVKTEMVARYEKFGRELQNWSDDPAIRLERNNLLRAVIHEVRETASALIGAQTAEKKFRIQPGELSRVQRRAARQQEQLLKQQQEKAALEQQLREQEARAREEQEKAAREKEAQEKATRDKQQRDENNPPPDDHDRGRGGGGRGRRPPVRGRGRARNASEGEREQRIGRKYKLRVPEQAAPNRPLHPPDPNLLNLPDIPELLITTPEDRRRIRNTLNLGGFAHGPRVRGVAVPREFAQEEYDDFQRYLEQTYRELRRLQFEIAASILGREGFARMDDSLRDDLDFYVLAYYRVAAGQVDHCEPLCLRVMPPLQCCYTQKFGDLLVQPDRAVRQRLLISRFIRDLTVRMCTYCDVKRRAILRFPDSAARYINQWIAANGFDPTNRDYTLMSEETGIPSHRLARVFHNERINNRSAFEVNQRADLAEAAAANALVDTGHHGTIRDRTRATLINWLEEHREYPYMIPHEKQQMSHITHLSTTTIEHFYRAFRLSNKHILGESIGFNLVVHLALSRKGSGEGFPPKYHLVGAPIRDLAVDNVPPPLPLPPPPPPVVPPPLVEDNLLDLELSDEQLKLFAEFANTLVPLDEDERPLEDLLPENERKQQAESDVDNLLNEARRIIAQRQEQANEEENQRKQEEEENRRKAENEERERKARAGGSGQKRGGSSHDSDDSSNFKRKRPSPSNSDERRKRQQDEGERKKKEEEERREEEERKNRRDNDEDSGDNEEQGGDEEEHDLDQDDLVDPNHLALLPQLPEGSILQPQRVQYMVGRKRWIPTAENLFKLYGRAREQMVANTTENYANATLSRFHREIVRLIEAHQKFAHGEPAHWRPTCNLEDDPGPCCYNERFGLIENVQGVEERMRASLLLFDAVMCRYSLTIVNENHGFSRVPLFAALPLEQWALEKFANNRRWWLPTEQDYEVWENTLGVPKRQALDFVIHWRRYIWGGIQRKPRKQLSRQQIPEAAKESLRNWFENNLDDPYINRYNSGELCVATNLTFEQVSLLIRRMRSENKNRRIGYVKRGLQKHSRYRPREPGDD